jgi:hypothetical protein
MHAGLIALRDRVRSNPDSVALIHKLFSIKNTMGYGINSFLDFDSPVKILEHLVVGSEGTLAFVAEATFRIVDRSMQLCGAKGTSSELPIAHIFRDIRPFRIYDGPSEVHRWSISRRSVRHSQAGKLPGDWA